MYLSGHILSSAAQLVTLLRSSAWNLWAKYCSQYHLLWWFQYKTPQTQVLPTLSTMTLCYTRELSGWKKRLFAQQLSVSVYQLLTPVLEEGRGPQPVDGILRKNWSPHWGPPRKKRKTGCPWGSSQKAEVPFVLRGSGHRCQKEAQCHFTSSFLHSL